MAIVSRLSNQVTADVNSPVFFSFLLCFIYSQTPLKLVSAIKGRREKQGSLPRKLTVTWAPDVYDPIPTSVSHLPNPNKGQSHKSGNNKNGNNKQKNNGKSSRGSNGRYKK